MTADFFTRLAGRTLGKVSVVQPDILPIFAGTTTFPESEKIPSEYQEGRLYVAEDNGIPSSFLSAKPRVNMIDITLPEPSDMNHGVRTSATDVVNKIVTKVDDTVVNNELRSERCKVQNEATASTIGSDSIKATSKTRKISNFYSLSTLEYAEGPDRKITTISKSPPPNTMDGKTQYKLPEKDNYSKGEIFTGDESPSVSSLVADSARVQEKDKKLLLNCTDISEQQTIESSKNSNKLLEDKGRREARGSNASESSFNENKKNNRSHLAIYSADAEKQEIILPHAGETTTNIHVAARPLDNEKVYSLRENISENLEYWPVEIAYSTGAQSRETISALDDNSIEGIRKLAQSPIPQEQLIHVNIGRIYVKASLPQGHSEERHKIVKRDPPLSLDEYLKRRSGGSYE